MGLTDKFKVIIGGAETSQEKADQMGADGWAPNAVEAVTLCQRLMGQKE
jgi:5-methyltetrahydrofolate--homocysteine methyltransferase